MHTHTQMHEVLPVSVHTTDATTDRRVVTTQKLKETDKSNSPAHARSHRDTSDRRTDVTFEKKKKREKRAHT